MNVKSIRVTAIGAVLVVASLASTRVRAQTGGIAIGEVAPDVTVEMLDGRMVQLSSLTAGKPTVLEFWATWCPLCRQLEPAMKKAQSRHKDIVFLSVGVPQSQTAEKQKAYVEEHQLGGLFVFDRNEAAVKAFHAPHTSFVVVLDGAGKVVYTGVGPDQDIEEAIAQLQPAMRGSL